MSDPFFTKKRKRPSTQTVRKDKSATKPRDQSNGKKSNKRQSRDDEIDSESDRGDIQSENEQSDSSMGDETAAEKRLRIAKSYLDQVREEVVVDGFDATDIDRDLIASRLEAETLATREKLYLHISHTLDLKDVRQISLWTKEKSPITSVSHAHRAKLVFTTFKNGTIQKWSLKAPPHLKKTIRKAHKKEILCSDINADETYLATGSADKTLIVWSTSTLEKLRAFSQHRDSVNSLCFPISGTELFSASSDRTVKLFNTSEMSYIETLFGHQDCISSISTLSGTTAITAGSRDKTARLWKIVDESQLVFRGGDRREIFHEGSMDCAVQIDKELFVTGSDNGSLALWSTQKKKAVHRISCAHGVDPTYSTSAEKDPSLEGHSPRNPRWITALASVPYSDLVLSGSWNGVLGVWSISSDLRKLEKVGEISVGKGIVNKISIKGDEKSGFKVIAALSYEIRGGRWKTLGGVRNSFVVVDISKVLQ